MFHIIDIFEKDNKDAKYIQDAFLKADFSAGKMFTVGYGADHKKEDTYLDLKNNQEMLADLPDPSHPYHNHYKKQSYYGKSSHMMKKMVDDCWELIHQTCWNFHTDFIFSKYLTGGYYHQHVDSQKMGKRRTDYSVTIFINEPYDYEGGELCIDVGTQEVKFKLPAGKAILYPTGIKHRVSEVTSGERHVCVFWLESAIQDVRIRDIYRGLDAIGNKYVSQPNAGELISKETYALKHQLLRHYANYQS